MTTRPAHHLVSYFDCTRLPEYLRRVAGPYSTLAKHLDDILPIGVEKSQAMLLLLESRDYAMHGAPHGTAQTRKREKGENEDEHKTNNRGI